MRGHVFGAFRECSRDVHALLVLHETAAAASPREWRECGATSSDAARAAYTVSLIYWYQTGIWPIVDSFATGMVYGMQ